ncbi:MAG: cell division protein ZapA [Gemmatimonadota bacterium]
MSSEKSLVRVTIAGEEYTLRAEATPEYTRECARYVDATIADIKRQSRSMMEPHKAAILAALSIVDQYFKAAGELEALRERSDAVAARMAAEIEARLAAFDLAAHP